MLERAADAASPARRDAANETARSVMTDSVVSVSPEASLADVLRLFVEEGVHGAPVIGDDGEIKGVISTSDLLRAQNNERSGALADADYLREYLDFSGPAGSDELVDLQDRLAQQSVSEVMTPSYASVTSDASISEVARCLYQNKIHRVWVEENGRLCGVISALDLMPLLE